MNFPENLKYTKEHEWISIDGNVARVGVTDFAQNELGDIVYIDIEMLGESVEKDEVFGTIEAVKTVSDLFMPLSGNVTTLNPALEADPQLVNTDPYGEGWMVEIELGDNSQIDSLLSSSEYKEIVG